MLGFAQTALAPPLPTRRGEMGMWKEAAAVVSPPFSA